MGTAAVVAIIVTFLLLAVLFRHLWVYKPWEGQKQ